MPPDFKKSSLREILRQAARLDGKSLRSALADIGQDQEARAVSSRKGKGNLGQYVEELFYGIDTNSESEPDFKYARLELKTTGAKILKSGRLVPKERLVLSIINYVKLGAEKEFETSSLLKKNARLLIHCYLYIKGKNKLDLKFLFHKLWRIPETDRKIIRADWEKIHAIVREGRAHELSEKDTLYLSACTKGATKKSKQDQYGRKGKAKQRAFSFKAKYLGMMLDDELKVQSSPFIKDASRITASVSLEDLVRSEFERYYGWTVPRLKRKFRIRSNSKHDAYRLACAILRVRSKTIEEFEKAEIQVKTITVENSGALKESMSFRSIRFPEFKSATWENSQFFEELDRKFLFVIFQRDRAGIPVLTKVMFWSMPQADLDLVGKVWRDTKAKALNGDYSHFIGIRANLIAHVRPKGRDGADLTTGAHGERVKKKCFWLNSCYIKAQIQVPAAIDYRGSRSSVSLDGATSASA